MDASMLIWFNITTYFLGVVFLYLGYRIRSRKQISLLGNIGELKKKKHLNAVCKLTSFYSLFLGATFIITPIVYLVFNLYAVMAMIGVAIVVSLIFWLTLSKVYFISPSQQF